MLLKFIGIDGSMKLINGAVYNVEVTSKFDFIWVKIPKFNIGHGVFRTWECPYASPQTFAENWSKP